MFGLRCLRRTSLHEPARRRRPRACVHESTDLRHVDVQPCRAASCATHCRVPPGSGCETDAVVLGVVGRILSRCHFEPRQGAALRMRYSRVWVRPGRRFCCRRWSSPGTGRAPRIGRTSSQKRHPMNGSDRPPSSQNRPATTRRSVSWSPPRSCSSGLALLPRARVAARWTGLLAWLTLLGAPVVLSYVGHALPEPWHRMWGWEIPLRTAMAICGVVAGVVVFRSHRLPLWWAALLTATIAFSWGAPCCSPISRTAV